MKANALSKQKDTSGTKAAALIGAGIGLTALGFSDTILSFMQPLLNFLGNFGMEGSHSSVNQAAVGATGWLGSWIVLHQRWKRKRKRIRTLLILGGLLLVLSATGFLGNIK